MKPPLHPFAITSLLLLSIASVFTCALASDPHPLTDLGSFQLKDQFGTEYTETSFDTPVMVFICGDRKGSEYTTPWSVALKNRLSEDQREKVSFVDVASLQSVPSFFKGYVRRKFPQDKSQWALLDWDGVFAKRFSFQDDHCNIVAFDEQRHRIHQIAVTGVDPSVLDDFLTRIALTLPDDGESGPRTQSSSQ